jgi:hypothetical protein
MRITSKKVTVKLENLERGMVFTLPNHAESIYMVINEHDYYINSEALGSTEVVFIDLEDGEILTLDRDTEVILINGSFVIDN